MLLKKCFAAVFDRVVKSCGYEDRSFGVKYAEMRTHQQTSRFVHLEFQYAISQDGLEHLHDSDIRARSKVSAYTVNSSSRQTCTLHIEQVRPNQLTKSISLSDPGCGIVTRPSNRGPDQSQRRFLLLSISLRTPMVYAYEVHHLNSCNNI